MTCYLCSNLNENQRNTFKCTGLSYISKDYLNWKKAISRFSDHSKFALHSHAMEVCHIKAITPLSYNQQYAQFKKNNITLRHILTSITFLVSQYIALRGKNTTYGNFSELIALICNNIPELKAWFNTENRKSLISTTIQNEMIAIYANNIKKNILKYIHGPYSVM